MVQVWDDTIKRLIRENPQHFISWVLEDAEYKDALSLELKNSTREADALLAATWRDQEILLHFEFQSTDDDEMDERTLEYHVFARRQHKRPVYSYIVYLRKDKNVVNSPLAWPFPPTGEETVAFRFKVIRLWELQAEEIFQTGLTGLFPLLPLTKDGKQRDITGTMVKKVAATEQPAALLGLAKAFAALVFTDEADKEWLERIFAVYKDILDDSWAVQEWKKEGKIEGKIEGLQETLLGIFQDDYPEFASVAKTHIDTINDAELLQHLIVKISRAQTPADALKILSNMNHEEKKE
jgi:predicted transposase/invertase (TIGR01784 family)